MSGDPIPKQGPRPKKAPVGFKRGGALKRTTPLRARTNPKRSVEEQERRDTRADVRLDEAIAFRTAVYARSGGACEAPDGYVGCGDNARRPHGGDHAHHVRQRSAGGGNDPDNGLYLCAPAHRWAHEHIAEAERLSIILRSS